MPTVKKGDRGAPRRVTLGEVARRLGRPRSTVYLQALRGELPVVWRLDRYEMEESELERLEAKQSDSPFSPPSTEPCAPVS